MKHQLIATLLTSIALLTPLGAQAGTLTPITEITIGGTYKIFKETTAGVLTPVASNIATVKEILMDNTARGNVELGKFSLSPLPTTMEVTFAGGSTASFSNPLYEDWTYNGNALAHSYITDAGNSVGITLSPSDLALATSYFLTQNAVPGIEVWRLASDPNIATVDLVNGQIKVGLDGLFNASNFLNFLFAGQVTAPINAQASEVVKVTYNGSRQYLYSFSATETGYQTLDGTQSYNGRYTDQTVPEPTTLLMLGLGFIGFGYMHRHNKRDQTIAA